MLETLQYIEHGCAAPTSGGHMTNRIDPFPHGIGRILAAGMRAGVAFGRARPGSASSPDPRI